MRKYQIVILILGIAIGLYLRDLIGGKEASAKIITVRSRNIEYQVETRAETIGELYAQDWIADGVKDDRISSGLVINLTKPVTVTIHDGAKMPVTVETRGQTVDDLLAEQKVSLAKTDRVTPNFNSFLAQGLEVKIDRIVDLEVTEIQDIPFEVFIEDDPSSFYGREELVQSGVNGKKEMKYMITYENGVEIKRRLLAQTVADNPRSEHRRLGTRIEVQQTQEGRASWYAYKSCLCAAHPSYLKGRYVRVTAVSSGKSVIVKINDRGPDQSIFPDRVIDLDAVAYKLLAPLGSGTIAVKTELLKQ